MDASRLALVDYFIRGGIFMWPLLLCSLTGLTIVVYKAWDLFAAARGANGLADEVARLTSAGNVEAATKAAAASRAPAGAVMAAVLACTRRSREALHQAKPKDMLVAGGGVVALKRCRETAVLHLAVPGSQGHEAGTAGGEVLLNKSPLAGGEDLIGEEKAHAGFALGHARLFGHRPPQAGAL